MSCVGCHFGCPQWMTHSFLLVLALVGFWQVGRLFVVVVSLIPRVLGQFRFLQVLHSCAYLALWCRSTACHHRCLLCLLCRQRGCDHDCHHHYYGCLLLLLLLSKEDDDDKASSGSSDGSSGNGRGATCLRTILDCDSCQIACSSTCSRGQV